MKGIFLNCFHTFGNAECFHTFAVMEGILSDGPDAFGQDNFLKVCTVCKGIASHRGNALFDLYPGDISHIGLPGHIAAGRKVCHRAGSGDLKAVVCKYPDRIFTAAAGGIGPYCIKRAVAFCIIASAGLVLRLLGIIRIGPACKGKQIFYRGLTV